MLTIVSVRPAVDLVPGEAQELAHPHARAQGDDEEVVETAVPGRLQEEVPLLVRQGLDLPLVKLGRLHFGGGVGRYELQVDRPLQGGVYQDVDVADGAGGKLLAGDRLVKK